jgi:predicted polyphosphate/ATP-dependent NAD kinase
LKKVPVAGSSVGIIANPVSGKDIRRLVAHGSVFDNQEKVRIVRRILMGLDALGVEKVLFMPDYYGIVERAGRGCSATIPRIPVPLKMEGLQNDSTISAAWMADQSVGCIIVLGGDGTCRAVAKGTCGVPLLPVSTGTNNVFPYMIEATVGGMAAGLIATKRVPREAGVYRSCLLEVLEGETLLDIALVDVAVVKDRFIAARAIWDMSAVSQIFLTRARPDAIGLSAIGGQLYTIDPREPRGLYLSLGSGHRQILSPIAPGLIEPVGISDEKILSIGDRIAVDATPCVLALDGEREVEVSRGRNISVRLSDQGPLVVDITHTMAHAQTHGLLVEKE